MFLRHKEATTPSSWQAKAKKERMIGKSIAKGTYNFRRYIAKKREMAVQTFPFVRWGICFG